jgi:peptide/nickel transport system permease protein
MSGILLRGDFGHSFEWDLPVKALLWERLSLTLILSLSTLLFTWVVAFPIGIYSAVKQYSLGDYLFTTIGFVGLAIPNFLLALVLMYISFKYLNQSVGGLFSPDYIDAPWNWAKFMDLMGHLWIPVMILGTAGTAGLIRIMRANLLDELRKPYVKTARAKGLSETKLLLKYPVRVALNPFISTIGWTLPILVSGSAIVSVVLSLPTTGPLLLRALIAQDMYLAGSFILMLGILTIIGTLISDILLAWLDPRIRY